MQNRLPTILIIVLTLATIILFPLKEVLARPLNQETGAPLQLIEAVNELRLAYGLPPLNVHPVLMQVAQIEAEGLAAGRSGHWHPNNLTLGQWLLSLGYPLSGDLSLDGYRSENVVWRPNFTVQDAIRMWNNDAPHTNTMLSAERSDIGAGTSTATDEWGQTVNTILVRGLKPIQSPMPQGGTIIIIRSGNKFSVCIVIRVMIGGKHEKKGCFLRMDIPPADHRLFSKIQWECSFR